LADPAPKERIAGQKAIRDQAQTDAERAQAAPEGSALQAITPTMLCKFASTARERIRIEGGGFRRDHLRAPAPTADSEIRIMGSRGDLLRTLAGISGTRSATGGVRSSVLKRQRECQSPPKTHHLSYGAPSAKA
jgi:site-specific DNA recombinase